MIAAQHPEKTALRVGVYARKSNKVEDATSESVVRQLEHATEYATKKGWVLAEHCIFVDDGITGARDETKRPGLHALLTAIKSRPRPFDVLVAAADDRLARKQLITALVLYPLHVADIRLHYYQEAREADLSSAVGVFMEAVRAFGSEFYRESQTRHMVDELRRKARAGFVHGGRGFGYDNVRTDGHVDRIINEDEARVVLRIFTRYAEGAGFRTIAKELNAERLPCPRPSKGGPAEWSPITIRDVLRRRVYIGEVVSRWGDEVFRVERPDLRIIPPPLWDAVQQRRQQVEQIYLRSSGGKLWSKPANGVESKYLLSGMALCPCGSPLTVRSRSHGRKRASYYVCRAKLDKGSVCDNGMWLPLPITDNAVLAHLEGVLLHPDVIAEAIRRLTEPDPTAEAPEQQRARLHRDLAHVERELANFTNAIAAGGARIETVLTAIKLREQRRAELQAMLARLDGLATAPPLDLTALRPRIAELLKDWRGLAGRHVAATRQLLRKLLVGRITFTPERAGVVRFRGEGTLAPIIGRLELQAVQGLVAPTGFEPVFESHRAFASVIRDFGHV
jgi:site-specific DNA recombinase